MAVLVVRDGVLPAGTEEPLFLSGTHGQVS
jgi:hypothetical protein